MFPIPPPPKPPGREAGRFMPPMFGRLAIPPPAGIAGRVIPCGMLGRDILPMLGMPAGRLGIAGRDI